MTPRFYVRVSTVLAAALVISAAFGQGRGTTTPPAGGTTGGTTTNPGTTAPTTGRTPTPNTQPTQPAPQLPPQPIFVTGRVMMEEGSAPPESVVIENVCNGSAHAEGYTDNKGYFAIELGSKNSGVLQDASEYSSSANSHGGFGGTSGGFGSSSTGTGQGQGMDQRFFACELRARLSGYRSQTVSLAMRRPLDDPNIGIILLHRITPNEGGTVSAISLAAPKDARKAFDKGKDALKKKKADEAVKSFEKAVEVYPRYATAWFELGRLQTQQGRAEDAKKSFENAMQADPKFVNPYLELSIIAAKSQNWQEVADMTDKMVRLDPFDYPQAFYFNSVANFNLKNVEAAEKSAREAARLDTRHQYPKSSHLLGVILAQRHDFSAAADEFRNYLKFAPGASDAETVKKQLDEVEKLSAAAKQQ
jgi:tetratricopeptide (TPR) repeat protein